jgi:hypothetical protein
VPIEGVSDIRRLPRLGKIRLGIKVIPGGDKNPYPKATDYFVVPDEVKELTGDKPTKLNIMFPSDDEEIIARQYLKAYSYSQGLVCKGDGRYAIRKIDTATGALVDKETQDWIFSPNWTCNPDECPEYAGQHRQCRRVMNLVFLMPEIPGLGVWQLDTSSFYSILNVNSCLTLIRALCGRISFIPLILSLEPMEVTPPGVKRKTVHVLFIRSSAKLADIQRLALVSPYKAIVEATSDEETPPDDLIPPEVVAAAEASRVEAEKVKPPEAETKKEEQKRTPANVTDQEVADQNTLFRLCYEFWKMQPGQVRKELGGVVGKPWEAFVTIKALKEEKP